MFQYGVVGQVVYYFFGCYKGFNWYVVVYFFGQQQYIWYYIVLFKGLQCVCVVVVSLYFIQYQQGFYFVVVVLYCLQLGFIWVFYFLFCLYGFQYYCCCFCSYFFQIKIIVKVQVFYFWQQWMKSLSKIFRLYQVCCVLVIIVV